jgi:hypothetical protein
MGTLNRDLTDASLPGSRIRHFEIALILLGAWIPAAAQQSDGESRVPTTSSKPLRKFDPSAPRSGGSLKAVLRPFGPYVTQTGVGFGGADVSEAYLIGGFAVHGYSMQAGVQVLADDFEVPSGALWTPSTVKWLSYQTGAPTTGTITAMYMNLWNTDPEGKFPGSQSLTGGQVFQSQAWTGVYRITEGGYAANNRAIIEVSCSGWWIGSIGPGTYWLDCTAEGSLVSGPWGPPETKPNQQPGQNPQWNGLAAFEGNSFSPVLLGIDGQDFLFQIEGANGAFSKFCSSKPSSLPGCTPTLSASSTLASKSGAPACIVRAAPVPGGAGLPGILIYSMQAPVPPINTNFGPLCLAQLQRAGAFSAIPGGVPGACNGAYNWNVAAIAAGTPGIAIGDELRVQAWYRDPPNLPGGANFTEGIDALLVVP